MPNTKVILQEASGNNQGVAHVEVLEATSTRTLRSHTQCECECEGSEGYHNGCVLSLALIPWSRLRLVAKDTQD